jgi:hypothetical protein
MLQQQLVGTTLYYTTYDGAGMHTDNAGKKASKILLRYCSKHSKCCSSSSSPSVTIKGRFRLLPGRLLQMVSSV